MAKVRYQSNSGSKKRPTPREPGRMPPKSVSDGINSRTTFFEFLKPIASAIQETLGPLCETVIHDFSDPEHSIIWIQGNVTGRTVGGTLSEIGLATLRAGNSASDKINYVRNARDNRVLKSTTVLLRDPSGNAFGCLCINLDVTDILAGTRALKGLSDLGDGLREVRFSDQIGEVLTEMISAAEKEIGHPVSVMQREDREAFIRLLEARGAFTIRRSVPTVASFLGISRAALYKNLDNIRNGRKNSTLSESGAFNDRRAR
jgi:predicted transcriptional regulator YheO